MSATELKPGYKQTEVGVIPADWEVAKLSDLCRSINDGTHFTPRYVNQGVPFYSVENVTADVFDDTKFITEEAHTLLTKRCKPEKGDILLTRIGSLGDTKLLDWDVNASIYVSLALLKLNDRAYPEYVYSYSKSRTFVRDVEKRSLLNATPKKINMGDIGGILIPVPTSLPEQRAIGAVLGDVDALISALDQLIAKMRDLKQAAMQQLLTGKQRLPGFRGEWNVKRLGNVVEIVSGGTPKTGVPAYWDGEIKWCTPTDITGTAGKYLSETGRTISALGLANCSARLLPPGALLLCSRATIGEVKIAGCAICTNQGFKSLICSNDVNNEFLYYMLLTMKPQMVEKAIGSTFLEISKKDTVMLEVSLPPLSEQIAIATVLSDMDAELAALEQKRDKTRALKQGMMQELLTGKTRLVDS